MSESTSGRTYYPDYLGLETLLNSQHPVSARLGRPAHDEMLFIVVHQAYELWFKQILYELDAIIAIFAKDHVDHNGGELTRANHYAKRIIRILELLVQQIDVMETMTPMDFLEFRSLLEPASGFQSKQFRLLEAKLGLPMDRRHQGEHYKRTDAGGFRPEDQAEITAAEAGPALRPRIAAWLERMPFLKDDFWAGYTPAGPPHPGLGPFWSDFRRAYSLSLTDAEREARLADFDRVFITEGSHGLPPGVLRSALFIMLYRDPPGFHHANELLTAMVEIDELLTTWRYRHLLMVRRMIGTRVGTGGTSGAGYLEGAIRQHTVFRELTELTTFMIERSRLPTLPEAILRQLIFRQA